MLAIYGLIVAVILVARIAASGADDYDLASGCAHLGAGLIVGLPCMAAGLAIGRIGQHGLATYVEALSSSAAAEPSAAEGDGATAPLLPPGAVPANGTSVYVSMVLNLIYAEAIGLYGLIVALLIVVGKP